jgi:hypothetical protein
VSRDRRSIVKPNAVRIGCWLVAVALGVGAAPALAQGPYVQVDYMKVAPGRDDAYVALERDVWKPYHETLVKAGRRAAWRLYAVLSPAGSEVAYNYVTANVFERFADMEDPFATDVLAEVHPGKDMTTLFDEAAAVRDGVRSETWQLIDEVRAEGPPTPARYIMVNYMKVPVGGDADYLGVERELWKPLHESRVADGHAAGWALYALRFPSGAALDYNYATVDSYAEYGDLENPLTLEMVEKVHPGGQATFDAIGERTNEVRELVRTELWELLETTGAE